MKRGFAYSKRLALAGAAAIVAASTMCALRVGLNSLISAHRYRASGIEGDLAREITARAEYDEANLDALRAEVGRFRVHLGKDGVWDRLVSRLGKDWTAKAEPRDDRYGYSIQLGTIRKVSSAVADWPEIVEVVKELEGIPGVGIVEIEMKASGNREHRLLDLVRILVEIRTSRADSKPFDP